MKWPFWFLITCESLFLIHPFILSRSRWCVCIGVCACMHLYVLYVCEWRTFPLSFPFLLQILHSGKKTNLEIYHLVNRCHFDAQEVKKKNEWMNEREKKIADSSLSDTSKVQQWMGKQQKARIKFVSSRSLTFCVRVCVCACMYLDQVFGSEITFLLSMIFIGYKLVCAKLLRRKFTYQ